MIRFTNASIGYGKRTILTGVDCEIGDGEFVGLVGPNGSGKTTFLRAVLGLLDPTAGSAEVDRSHRFAYVPQVDELNLLWPLTVDEMVSLAVRSRRAFGRTTTGEKEAIENAVVRTGMKDLRRRRYDQLSGGQRQRAILAQALAQTPDVLLLDEPTRGLDVRMENDLIEILRSLNADQKLTILFVTHTLAIPINVTEKIFLFHDGRVVQTSSKELATSDRLEKIYGIPFVHAETEGVRWVAPRSGR